MAEKNHLQYLDVYKGAIIFLVVVGHAFHFGFTYYQSPLLTMLKSLDMPSFLFMSGFLGAGVLSFDRKSIVSYWLKKSRQLLLPLATLPFLYAYLYKLDMMNILLDKMHGGYWFTFSLFEMFVLVYLVRVLNRLINQKNSAFVEVVLGLLSLAFVLLIDDPWQQYHVRSWEALSWGKMNYLYYYFLFGYFVGRFKELEQVITAPIIHALSGIAFVLLLKHDVHAKPMLDGLLTSFSGVLFAYATVKQIGNLKTRANSLLSYLGKESRTIYLTHYFFLCSAPIAGNFLKTQVGSERIFLWELLLSFTYAGLVVAVTLVAVRIIRSSKILDTLFYGKRLDSWT